MKPITQPAKSSLRGTGPALPDANAPRVSVVIPTHNRAGLVVRAIRCVLEQTMSDLELIVVDDASTADTAAAVVRIDDPRLQFVQLAKNGGQAHATNVGIARARAEWVAFLDDDDEWLPDKLAAQLARLAQTPDASAVYCLCYVQTSEELRSPRPRSDFPEGDIMDSLLRRSILTAPSAYMVRREALLAVGGFDETFVASQDIDLWLRMSQAGYRFASVPEPLMIFHQDSAARLTMNPVARAIGFVRIDRRWGALMRSRISVEAHERWRGNRTKRLVKAHQKLVRNIARSGSRSAALAYLRSIAPLWPWGARFTLKALAVVVFGRLLHRISRVRQGKAGPAWLRRLFGVG